MKRYQTLLFAVICLSPVQLTIAQTSSETASALPRLVRFGGTVTEPNGKPLAGVAGITFTLYSEQTGGAPLWMETQNITADSAPLSPAGCRLSCSPVSRRTGWEYRCKDSRNSRGCCWSAPRMH